LAHIPKIHDPLPVKNANRKHSTIPRPIQLHTGPVHPNQSKAQLRSSTIGASLDQGRKLGTHAYLSPQVLNVAPTYHAGPNPRGAAVGGGTSGTAPPLTLDLALAQLTRPCPGHHPRDEGALDWLFSSVFRGHDRRSAAPEECGKKVARW